MLKLFYTVESISTTSKYIYDFTSVKKKSTQPIMIECLHSIILLPLQDKLHSNKDKHSVDFLRPPHTQKNHDNLNSSLLQDKKEEAGKGLKSISAVNFQQLSKRRNADFFFMSEKKKTASQSRNKRQDKPDTHGLDTAMKMFILYMNASWQESSCPARCLIPPYRLPQPSRADSARAVCRGQAKSGI